MKVVGRTWLFRFRPYTRGMPASGPSFAEYHSRLYGFWVEVPFSGQYINGPYQFHVKVYNGKDAKPVWNAMDRDGSPLNCRGGLGGSSGQILQAGGLLFAA